ncbi:MAG: hypothetical protein GTN80_03805, partial [Nitrososphaeria archaeon]|nr:hypothetical protein [Nitrososphaeria archaeon]NIN52277.1 hypothetical protein [Nitrososphaeria archaeon]NIQ32755.1 hypothetical protein [Nitrososphaeria archaeon]
MRDTIHGEAAKLKRVLELVRRDLPLGEVGVVDAFVDSCLADGLSAGRTCRYVYCLRKIRGLLDVDFKDVSRGDVERVMLALNGMGYAPQTLLFFRVAFKKFYRWLRGSEETPPEGAWLRSTVKESEQILPEDILSPEEVKMMLAAAMSIRDKVFIETLYDGGLRIGEMLGL